jgi:RNA polymerase sigma-70 factor, ECF subfamily
MPRSSLVSLVNARPGFPSPQSRSNLGPPAASNGAKKDTDEELIDQVRAGDVGNFAVLVQRHNQRIYRVARAILRDDAEAEDTVQQVHLAAYLHLAQFQGRSSYATWITRIAIREAIGRAASRRRHDHDAVELQQSELPAESELTSPEEIASRRELVQLLEAALDSLPEHYRLVLMLREVERLSTAETADALGMSEENVRVRVHRARGLLKDAFWQQIGSGAEEAFSFGGERCARTLARVMREIESVQRRACD